MEAVGSPHQVARGWRESLQSAITPTGTIRGVSFRETVTTVGTIVRVIDSSA